MSRLTFRNEEETNTDQAFVNCKSLDALFLPASVKLIHRRAFTSPLHIDTDIKDIGDLTIGYRPNPYHSIKLS